MKNQLYPCLWFNGRAEEAATIYCSLFRDSKIVSDNPFVVIFESAGEKFMCLNGNHNFGFNSSISFMVVCETTDELEKAWQGLSEGGTVLMPLDKYEWSEKYGWVQDQYGISWQLSLGKVEEVGQKFSPTLMFTGNKFGKAEEAVHYYTSVFENSSIRGILKYNATDAEVEGAVKHAQFEIAGYTLMAMDSSLDHGFDFNEAISLVINCDTQEEIDYYWGKLTDGGEESMCGWLKDRFGVSWQVVPSVLGDLMNDPKRSGRVVEAFMKMKKFDINKLLNA